MIIFIIIVVLILFFIREGIPCIMYHNVSSRFDLSIEEFEKQIKQIRNMNTYKFEEIEKFNYVVPRNSILLTFDDGYKNNYTKAYPILKKYNKKATIFLNTAYIGVDEDYLTWDQILEMYSSGLIDFQLHSHSHFSVINKLEIEGFFSSEDFNKKELYREIKNIYGKEPRIGYPIFKRRGELVVPGYRLTNKFINGCDSFIDRGTTLTEAIVKEHLLTEIVPYSNEEYKNRVFYEINNNKEIIDKEIGRETLNFANPWGQKSEELLRYLKIIGIKSMITTKKGTNSRKLDPYKIKRYEANSIAKFRVLLLINKSFFLGKIYEILS